MQTRLTYSKFISCLAFGLCMMTSCSSDIDDVIVNVGKGSEISFSVAESTRAADSPAITEFAIYGDMKFPVDDATAPSQIFSKTKVAYSSGRWTAAETQHWFPRHEHSFVAISPIAALETGDTPKYLNSQLSFTYKIPTAEDNRVTDRNDIPAIVAATHRRLYNDGDTNNTVTLRFANIMSQINLSPAFADNVIGADHFIEVKEVELSGFNTQATFEILPAPRQTSILTDDRVIDISGHDKVGALAVRLENAVKVANNQKNVNIFGDGKGIIMIPQSFGADSEAKIILSYTVDGDNDLKKITLPLSNQKWETGKSYNYRFTISRTGLVLDVPIITNWDALALDEIDAH